MLSTCQGAEPDPEAVPPAIENECESAIVPEFAEQIVIECVKIIVPLVIKGLFGDSRLKPAEIDRVSDAIRGQLSEAIERHLTEVVNWATRLQFFGMAAPLHTEQSTIALDIYTQPRRFCSVDHPQTITNEEALLSNPDHILLLGDPGSGKTTTLKRIALSMLTKEPTSCADTLQFPMVIRLRELEEGESLYHKIADIFGLLAEPREFTIRRSGVIGRGKKAETEMRINKDSLKLNHLVPDCLNGVQPLLLLDGLDELSPTHMDRVRSEIVSLGRGLNRSKIITSCRSGDYTKQMDGFTIFEISPLSDHQIRSMAKIWLGTKHGQFIERLRYFPYVDVTDRPLLLAQLLFMFKRSGYLPEQPAEIYEKLVNLLLKDWDEERDIKRSSKYAGFGPERKAKFLAALAYQLTFSLQKKMFKEADLAQAYGAICHRFGLPQDQALQVAHEIQTHTGIISIGPGDLYEFYHLSLQEYLCADYLVRASAEIPNIRHLSRYCAPLAVAVALSSDPSQWFGSLILSYGNIRQFDEESMVSFLSRVLVERPIFADSEPLGFAMLALFERYNNSLTVCRYLEQMLEITSVKKSIAEVMRWYIPKKQQPFLPNFYAVTLKTSLLNPYSFALPSEAVFPKRIIRDLSDLRNGHLFTKEYR